MKSFVIKGLVATIALGSIFAVSYYNNEAKNKMEPIFLDVRTEDEWNQGHIQGALHFELSRIQNGEVPHLPKDTPINIYCRSGNRAEEARLILEKKGFSSLKNLGGISDISGTKICYGENKSC